MRHRHFDPFRLLQVFEGARSPEYLFGDDPITCLTELAAEADLLDPLDAPAEDEPEEAPDYSGSFASALARVAEASVQLEADAQRVDEELAGLVDAGPDDALALVGAARTRYASPLLVDRLLAEARTALRRSPREALGWIEVADLVAFRVNVTVFSHSFVHSLLVRIAAHRANALRVAGELREADARWQEIQEDLQREPVGDVETEAELASLLASLRQDQRRFEEADRLMERAAMLYADLDDDRGVARALIKQGILRRLAGEPSSAIAILDRALELSPHGGDRRLELNIGHNRFLCFCDLGDYDRAAEQLGCSRHLYEVAGDQETFLLLRWLEGRIAIGQRHFEPAETHLLTARNGFLAQRRGFSMALVSLDLARLYLGHGRTSEVKRMAETMVAIFDCQEVHAEAIRALKMFQEAAAMEQVTGEFLSSLSRYLTLAQRDPGFRFQAPL
jgi:tetratricopeptide (TPR) repeat protein